MDIDDDTESMKVPKNVDFADQRKKQEDPLENKKLIQARKNHNSKRLYRFDTTKLQS